MFVLQIADRRAHGRFPQSFSRTHHGIWRWQKCVTGRRQDRWVLKMRVALVREIGTIDISRHPKNMPRKNEQRPGLAEG